MQYLIERYFPNLSSEIIEKLCDLYYLYKEWNSKINVISRKNFSHERFCIEHILYSLAALKFVYFKDEYSVLDVGTGGGFPGIPLALIFHKVNFTLLDSRRKKLIVVEDIVNKLKLKNVNIKWDRVENVFEKYDYVTGRAVKDIEVFYEWTKKNVKKNGKIIYWSGGDYNKSFVKKLAFFKVFNIKDIYREDFFSTKKLLVFK